MIIDGKTIIQLENIFKVEFTNWQIQYLKGNYSALPKGGRVNGKTLVYCIRLLLTGNKPITKERLIYDGWKSHFINSIIEINNKLLKAGFKTNMKKERKK